MYLENENNAASRVTSVKKLNCGTGGDCREDGNGNIVDDSLQDKDGRININFILGSGNTSSKPFNISESPVVPPVFQPNVTQPYVIQPNVIQPNIVQPNVVQPGSQIVEPNVNNYYIQYPDGRVEPTTKEEFEKIKVQTQKAKPALKKPKKIYVDNWYTEFP